MGWLDGSLKMSKEIIASNIVKTFENDKGEEVKALDNFNFESKNPEIVGIVGTSGCGKSTFLRLVAGLDFPTSGNLTYDNKKIEGPDYNRGFIFQSATLFDWLSIKDNISFGLKARKKLRGMEKDVDEYIDLMGLRGFENNYPYQVSGGMAARASFARTFIQEPDLVLLDEPLSALDAFTRMNLQKEILNIHQRTGSTFILVTHDLEEAVFLCDRVVVMSPRPGHGVGVVKIDMDHPRDRTSDAFIEYRKEILSLFPQSVKDFVL